ncbi:membrane protein [Pseudodesulfovibrio nedwellii]|uniref:Membrane protein n=1 Tax=Pseudodesulfovibrio nedwellii TaxID=2973072 RepID=A0ABM8AZL2_9BACT|nr:outer membrane protein transport protein [Pseudodesulfovibrio nedwellii]BDQ36731.1 membrane protein [Pseudodesulfovibrio nedwellii]
MKRASAIFFCSFVLCILASAVTVHAGGFALYEWGNRALGMGTANYATGNDASVIAYNPSQMTKLEGTNVYAGTAVINPMSDVYIDGDKSTTRSVNHVVPHAYITHQVNDDLYIGLGEYTRFGLGTKYDDDWAGATLLQEALLETYSLTPTVAYKVTDDLALSGGVEFIKGGFMIKKMLSPVGQKFKVDVDSAALAFNLSMLYDITDDLNFGFIYRSPVHFVGKGKATYHNAAGVLLSSGNATLTADFPASYTAGLGYSPIENLTFEFDIVYTQWEQFDRIEFDFDGFALPDTEEEFNYKSTWRFQLGAEYLVTNALALRAGYVYDQTPIRHEYTSPLLPANDRQMFTLGAGYAINNLTFDLSGMYIVTKERHGMKMTDAIGTTYDADFKNGRTWGAGLSVGYAF